MEAEFTFAFGGCTTMLGLTGSYLSREGALLPDRINLIYTDIPARFERNLATIERYADAVRQAGFAALEEETVLVAVHRVYHSVE